MVHRSAQMSMEDVCRLAIGRDGFDSEVQHRPEGPILNSHARKGVEQAIKLIPRSEGPADDRSVRITVAPSALLF
jgi:hypothetical protein